MEVVGIGILLIGGTLVFVCFVYWASSKYVDFRKRKDIDLSDAKQARMQENIVSGIILIVIITLAAWLCLVTPR